MVSSLLGGAGVLSMYVDRFSWEVSHWEPMLDKCEKWRLSEESAAEGVLFGLFIASW